MLRQVDHKQQQRRHRLQRFLQCPRQALQGHTATVLRTNMRRLKPALRMQGPQCPFVHLRRRAILPRNCSQSRLRRTNHAGALHICQCAEICVPRRARRSLQRHQEVHQRMEIPATRTQLRRFRPNTLQPIPLRRTGHHQLPPWISQDQQCQGILLWTVTQPTANKPRPAALQPPVGLRALLPVQAVPISLPQRTPTLGTFLLHSVTPLQYPAVIPRRALRQFHPVPAVHFAGSRWQAISRRQSLMPPRASQPLQDAAPVAPVAQVPTLQHQAQRSHSPRRCKKTRLSPLACP